jgi:hypothetical protein
MAIGFLLFILNKSNRNQKYNLNKPIIKSVLFAKTIDNVQTLMQSEDETFTSTERLSYDF